MKNTISSVKAVSVAEMADKHLKILAIAVFFMAIKYAVSAAMIFISEEFKGVVNVLELVVQVIAAVLILYIMFWKFRLLTREQRKKFFDSESYVVSVFNLAMQKALGITFVVLIILEAISRKSGLPADFFLNTIISLMLGVLSVVFFYKLQPVRS